MREDEIVNFIPNTIDWPCCPECGCVLTGLPHTCTRWSFRRLPGAMTVLPNERPIWCLRGWVTEGGE